VGGTLASAELTVTVKIGGAVVSEGLREEPMVVVVSDETVTVTTALFTDGQPAPLRTTNSYDVVTAGLATGAQESASSSVEGGDQEQATPPDPARTVDPPGAMVASPSARAKGIGSTVTVTDGALVETCPELSVTVSV
jgi:hypothetical protein